MPQFARPSADTLVGNYKNHAGSGSNIYQAIDEVSPANDADYIESPLNPASEVYVCKLSNTIDPLLSTGHVVRWRRGKSADVSSEQINLTVEVRQGYANEGALGTLIASKTVNNIPAAFTDDSLTLSGAEADSITDYTALYLRFVSTKP